MCEWILRKLFAPSRGKLIAKYPICKNVIIIYRHQCETANEVGPLTLHQIYMKTCVDFIMENDCPDPLICSINCASDTNIDKSTTKIIPFNNYGQYYLRIKTCLSKVHEQRLERYSVIQQDSCKSIDEFEVCSRWIPPSTFVPVALPIDTTYIEIDSCEIIGNGTYSCPSSLISTKVYGNRFLFPESYDVAQTASSICTTDSKFSSSVLIIDNCNILIDDCLGSFCDVQYSPSICSPKKIEQALNSGKDYMTIR